MKLFAGSLLSFLFAGLVLATSAHAGIYDLYYWTDATGDHQVGNPNNWAANNHDGLTPTSPADAVPGADDIAMFTLPDNTAEINATNHFEGTLDYPEGLVTELYVGEGTVSNWPWAPSPGPGHLVVRNTNLNYLNWLNVGRLVGPTAGTSTLDLYGAALKDLDPVGRNVVAEYSVAAMTLNEGSQWETRGWSIIGWSANANGSVTLNNSTWTCVANDITIGYHAVLDDAATAATGALTVNAGGLLDATGFGLVVGAENGNGTLNINGSGVVKANWLCTWSHASETSTVNFDGGTLVATAENSNLYEQNLEATPHIYVKAGGAKIDTNSYNVGIWEPLEEDPASTGGSFEKLGLGTLALSGACTYSGDTIVSAGTLSTAAADVLPDDTTLRIAVANGALVDLNFSGTDTIAGLFFDSAEQVTGVWGALGSGAQNESSYLTGTGLLKVVVPTLIPGDTDNDQDVDADDAAALATHWGQSVTHGDYTSGDFNGDGAVNAADASILAANWTGSNTTEGTNVPEPACLVFSLGMGLAALLRRTRGSRCVR